MKTHDLARWHGLGSDLGRRYFLKVGSLGLLGINLPDFLRLQSRLAAAEVGRDQRKAKAEACILIWLEGGPSHTDTWDPKPESSFRPISTNVPGIQISELLPRVSKHMDKLSIIRSLHTEESDHTPAIHYAATAHRPNAAMRFPSLGSIISKEMGMRNHVPSHVFELELEREPQVLGQFNSAFIGAEYDPMVLRDLSDKPELSLPKSITADRVAERRALLKVVDETYREKVETAAHAKMDIFTEQAMKMVLTP